MSRHDSKNSVSDDFYQIFEKDSKSEKVIYFVLLSNLFIPFSQLRFLSSLFFRTEMMKIAKIENGGYKEVVYESKLL